MTKHRITAPTRLHTNATDPRLRAVITAAEQDAAADDITDAIHHHERIQEARAQ